VGGLTQGRGVAYNGIDRWIAVGNGNRIVTSIDNGNNWNPVASLGGIDGTVFKVAYGNGLWVAVGSGTVKIATSTDNGNNWNPATADGSIGVNIRGVAFKK
jgi:hypothetical protein